MRLQQGLVDLTIISLIPVPGPRTPACHERAQRWSGWSEGPFRPGERDNWQTKAVFVRGKYLAQELWYDCTAVSSSPR